MRLQVEHQRARDVGGEQVGRELDPGEVEPGSPCDRAGRERLGNARQVVQQHVPVGEQGRQHESDRLALADHRAAHLVEDGVCELARFGHRRVDVRSDAARSLAARQEVGSCSSKSSESFELGQRLLDDRRGSLRVGSVVGRVGPTLCRWCDR